MKADGINPGGTHFPILAAAVARTAGPALECGIGDYSTPMLHYLCEAQGRLLVSCDNNEEWMAPFKKAYEGPLHSFCLVEDWLRFCPTGTLDWGVLFIDIAPGDQRPKLAKWLANLARFVVCHDTEAYGDGWPAIKGVFKYETIWKQYPTWTTVYSNFEEFKL